MNFRILLLLLFFSFGLAAQDDLSGKILYRVKAEVKRWGRSFTVEQRWELVFNDSLARCRWLPMEKEDENQAGAIKVVNYEREYKELYYTYLRQDSIHDYREIMGNHFEIARALDPLQWRITGKQTLVENYPCLEATRREDTITHLAWFAPQLKLPLGPKQWRGLPGIILYMELDNGRTVISIEDMNLAYTPRQEDFDLKPPPVKSRLSEAEFEALKEEKEAESRMMYGR